MYVFHCDSNLSLCLLVTCNGEESLGSLCCIDCPWHRTEESQYADEVVLCHYKLWGDLQNISIHKSTRNMWFGLYKFAQPQSKYNVVSEHLLVV